MGEAPVYFFPSWCPYLSGLQQHNQTSRKSQQTSEKRKVDAESYTIRNESG